MKKKQKKKTGIAKIAVASTLVDILYKVRRQRNPTHQQHTARIQHHNEKRLVKQAIYRRSGPVAI